MSTGSELYDLLAKTNATLNPNNTITLRFNDGSSYTTGVIKDGPELSPADKAMEEAKGASATSQAAMEEASAASTAAGNAEQSASAAAASATNAENFASAAQQSASTASTAATNAETSASDAATSASNAATSAQAAATSADAAESEAKRAASEANEAKTQAGEAKTQASRATSYANGALNSLSTTQDIIGVLNWVEESIKYVWDYPPTVEDKEYDPSKQYYTVIGKRVINPIETDYDKYYVLNSESEPASKTGNIVTFDSDLDNFPLNSLTATINPKQSGSGDPSPDNIRPISGWDSVNVTRSGKNLLPQQSDAIQPLFIPSGTQIFVSATPPTNSSSCVFNFYRADKSRIDYWTLNQSVADGRIGKNVTITEDTYYVAITNATALNKQIEFGTAATVYEPYQADTYHTSLPETVYGGSLDVVNGVLVIEKEYYQYNNINTTSGKEVDGGWRCDFRCPNGDINRGKWSVQVPPTLSMFDGSKPLNNGGISKGYAADSYTAIVPTATSKETAEAMLEGLQIVYNLAEPRTIQLTPKQVTTLLGTNNVWSDSGEVTVEYWDGPVGYVTPTSSFDPTETYYTVKGSPVKIDESKQEKHGKGLYYVHDLTNAKEAMADFIKARLALTDKGLYVVGGDTENEGYKILLASDGMTVYDAQGVAVSKFGENIEFSATRAQYIGNEDAFIVFNPEDGTINAGGEGFRFNNNMTLSEMLAEVGKVGRLEDDTNGLLQKTSSISYENGELILSDSTSAFAVKITNTKLAFMQGEQEVAYITGNQLYIPYTVVLNAMDVGPWRWRKQDNGNLTLQYIG